MSTFVPATALVFLGTALAVLGLLAAGSIPLIVVGIAAIFGAGILTVASDRHRAARRGLPGAPSRWP